MTDPFEDDVALAEYEAAQRQEYSKWEAAELITHGGTPAYNVGDPVPISNCERLGYARNGQVRLQHAFIENHPEDEDVKTFLAYADQYPDHPAARGWKRYQEQQSEREAAEAAMPPLTFGNEEKKPKTAKKAAPPAVKADDPSTTAKKG